MFRTFARIHLLGLRRPAPGPRTPIPANDNLPAVLRPGPRSRIGKQRLVCRWSLTGDGTRLACHWQAAPPRSAPERSRGDSRPGTAARGVGA